MLFSCCTFSLPLHFEVVSNQLENKEFSLKIVMNYFKRNLEGSKIFITSLLIMATGFSYTTVCVLTNHIFPGKSEVFGIAMTFCAIGGIVATIILPTILNHLSAVKMYYLSSLLFGLALLGVVIHNLVIMFICITLIDYLANGQEQRIEFIFNIVLKTMREGRY